MNMEALDSLVDVPGGQVFVRRWRAGRQDRPPIVLLHDSLGSVEQWRDFPAALASRTGREVLAYDRLGFGGSSARVALPSVDFVREEARIFFPVLREALDLPRFALFGHSVGGAMAIAVAALHGDGCEAVVTESAQAFVEPRTLASIAAAKLQFTDPEQFARLVKWHGANARWVLDAWTEVWLSAPFASWSLDPVLAQVRCPVLAIHGELDEYGSLAFPRRIVDRSGGPAELAILPQCGHVPHREMADDVLRRVAAFLQACQVPGAASVGGSGG